jgi:hypothetical protein
MSWLVAVCFPELLMLCAFGLQRIEKVLHTDRPVGGEIVATLEAAARSARERAAQRIPDEPSGFPEVLSGGQQVGRFDSVFLMDEPGLPTRPNPLFRAPVLVNPV